MKRVKVILINLSKKYDLFRKLLRTLMFIKQRLCYLIYYFKKIEDKQIVFESFMGRKYVDSPKAIYEFMLNNKAYKDYKFIWFFKKPENYQNIAKNKRTIVLKYGSKDYYKYYASSKYWVTNSRIPDGIFRKKGQKYIQCWHGTPLKRLGFDIEVKGKNAMNTIKDLRRKYQLDAKKYSYMISPSKFCSEKFISAFNLKKLGKENIIVEVGYPRNDFLINYKKLDVNNIKNKLKLPKDKKIILYAPTWRDNQHDSSIGYTYKTEIDFDLLQKKIGKEYVILFRAHYFIANAFDFEKYKDFIYNVSEYDDINDLYIISDMLITDYSSVFFDYANLKRPMIFYMYDFEDYKNNMRDFYIDINELPGPIVKTQKELEKELTNIDKNFPKYKKKYEKFNKKYNYLDDGKATKRALEKIIEEEKK